MPHGASHRWLTGLLVALVALLAFLQFRLWFGAGGHRSVEVLEQQVLAQARENSGLRERNDALAAEVEDLKSGEAAVEERARSELGMIRPGETFYRVVESGPSMPATRAPTPGTGNAGATGAEPAVGPPPAP